MLKVKLKTRKEPIYIPPRTPEDIVGRSFTQGYLEDENERSYWTYYYNSDNRLEYVLYDPDLIGIYVNDNDVDIFTEFECIESGEYVECSMRIRAIVYYKKQRNKFVLIDKKTGRQWANEEFNTIKEFMEFCKQNRLALSTKN
jgi:hypothetical protein